MHTHTLNWLGGSLENAGLALNDRNLNNLWALATNQKKWKSYDNNVDGRIEINSEALEAFGGKYRTTAASGRLFVSHFSENTKDIKYTLKLGIPRTPS